MRRTFFDALLDRAKQDKRIILITCDVGWSHMDRWKKELPSQFINAGIGEQNAVSMAAGLAYEGKIPVVCSITPFLILKCVEQIKLDILYNNVVVHLVGMGVGNDYPGYGITHQCAEDIEIIGAINNAVRRPTSDARRNETTIIISTPKTLTDAHEAGSTLADSKHPVYIRLARKPQ